MSRMAPQAQGGCRSQQLLRHCGRVVRTQRQALGLTQDDVGAKIGISGNTISALEQGQRWPLMAHLVAIGETLEIPWALMLPEDPWQPVHEFFVIPAGTPPSMAQSLREILKLYAAVREPPPACL